MKTEEDVIQSMIRNELRSFMVVMEAALKENDWKGGWENESLTYLYKKFEEEVDEVRKLANLNFLDLCKKEYKGKELTAFKAQFEKELIDVANVCMMLWSML